MTEFEKKALELLTSIKESTYGAVLAAEDIMAHVHDIEERLAALEGIKHETEWMSKVLHATACDVVEIKESLYTQQKKED